jgi:hypothetical protein
VAKKDIKTLARVRAERGDLVGNDRETYQNKELNLP